MRKNSFTISLAAIFRFVGIFCLSFSFFVGPLLVSAEVTSSNLNDKQSELEMLEAQIAQSQRELDGIVSQKQSLSKELSLAEATLANITKQKRLTTYKISQAEKNIASLENTIRELDLGITGNTRIVADLLRTMNRTDDVSFVATLFSPDVTFSDVAKSLHQQEVVQTNIRSVSDEMRQDQESAEEKKESLLQEKKKLAVFQSELADKERIAEAEKKSRDLLLKETKNKESSYKTYIADLEAREAQLESEIQSYESSLKFSLDPKSLPKAVRGTIGWPVDDVLITQRFGKTVDAKRLYAAGTHSGVDFRAAIGTPIYAVADGVVEGTGDTDVTCYKASFGKWVFIRHTNGLATAYGHLSLIKAVEGQKVKKGDLIAYSGNSGHSTGPHLHLTVYASYGVDGGEGARITDRPSEACKGKNYRMPLAPTNAYLDPLQYLPNASASMFKDQKLD